MSAAISIIGIRFPCTVAGWLVAGSMGPFQVDDGLILIQRPRLANSRDGNAHKLKQNKRHIKIHS